MSVTWRFYSDGKVSGKQPYVYLYLAYIYVGHSRESVGTVHCTYEEANTTIDYDCQYYTSVHHNGNLNWHTTKSLSKKCRCT